MSGIVEAKNVPHSPHTSMKPTEVFNPLNKDFTHPCAGEPYTIPAKSKVSFPEFVSYHLAKHLAREIVYKNFSDEVTEAAKGQLTPDTAKAVPEMRVETMQEWLLSPFEDSPEKELEKPIEVVQSLSKELTEGEQKALESYRKKVETMAKAREAKKKVEIAN